MIIMCTISTYGRPFGPNGCAVPVGNGTCGETRTLEIISEFRRLYEEKLHQIESAGGGDCLHEKIKLQQDWIGDLTAQNEMLVRAVEELEHEATERVNVLEEKLQQSAQSISEVMKRYREYDVTNDLLAEPLQKVFCLESDQKNLLEFIRRVREENRWDVKGLKFYEISYNDLFGSSKTEKSNQLEVKTEYKNIDATKGQEKLKDKDCDIRELQVKLEYYNSFGDIEVIAKELKSKKEECSSLRKSMEDMRQALVEEIAAKHDTIVQLKNDCQQLEDRCIQADKQTAFKDDIIKELRKEIKQLKQQKCTSLEKQNNSLKQKVEELENKKNSLETTLQGNKAEIERLAKDFKEFLKAKEELKQKNKECAKKCRESQAEKEKLLAENRDLKVEIEKLKSRNIELENELKSVKEDIEKCKLCKSKTDELTEKNEKLLKEMLKLNDENRNLLKTVENQKKRIDRTTKLTHEEIIKLNATIDDLHNNLRQTKNLQDEEEKRNNEKVSQLKKTVKDLINSLREAEEKYEKEARVCKICRGRSKVGFAESVEVQASLDVLQAEKHMEMIQNKDEIIKTQTGTLNVMKVELQSLKDKDNETVREREQLCNEVQCLHNTIAQLQSALEDAEGKATNLQKAVDFYANSVNVLEAAEEKCKIEINQQKLTISNLQRALVATKQELDEIRQKSQENGQEQHDLISSFSIIITDMEYEKLNLFQECECMTQEYEHLQELNFDLEVEHCNSLQDVDVLENQLFKYQSLLRSSEDEVQQYRQHCKKLMKQKRGYEEVVAYFKQEMSSMSEQLVNLQNLLTLSNESTQEETCKLMQAYTSVQAQNDKLTTQLAAAEQKVVLESQMNQLRETKICELQQLISERELDLSRHDQAILNIRQSLQCSLEQNEELQLTIADLNQTIGELHDAILKYEKENNKGKHGTEKCWEQISNCRQKLEELKSALSEKTTELCKLEMAYNDQSRTLKSVQMELKEMKEKQKDKRCNLKCIIDELREKLVKCEENYSKLSNDYSNLQAQLGSISKKEAVKDLEVKRYRKIVGDLKNTLIDLNKSLATGKGSQKPPNVEGSSNKCTYAECRKAMQLSGEPKNQDVCLNCPCEVEFYQSMVETLKKSVIDLKKKLMETEKRNQQLEEESKCKDARLQELSREKDKEHNDLRKKLTEKLKQAQTEEARYLELATQLERELSTIRQELEAKTIQLNDIKQSAQEVSSSKCVQLACAQEEVNSLKDELNRILRQHCSLNVENEKLHTQSACMQATVTKLEEKSQLLKGQLEQYLSELQSVQNEKELLVRKNRELLSELRSLQSSYNSANKKQRYSDDSVKNLESELNDLRHNRDDICNESKNVISYVRAWLQEQKKINEHTARREQNYCDTIHRLKKEYKDLQCQYMPPSQRPCKKIIAPCLKSSSPPPTCQSPWSLGSQGTASIRDVDSPSRSPCPQEESDWYSPTFRNESDDDDEEDEDDWVTKVENLAAQVRKANKMWKNKMEHSDYMVSKDMKK